MAITAIPQRSHGTQLEFNLNSDAPEITRNQYAQSNSLQTVHSRKNTKNLQLYSVHAFIDTAVIGGRTQEIKKS